MSLKIIGRNEEQQRLEACLKSGKSEFIAVYGRRRIGKTYLIKTFFENKKCLFFQTTGIQKGNLELQLKAFTQSISNTFYDGNSISPKSNWFDAFEVLLKCIKKNQNNKKPMILFLDECPWMATAKSKFLENLEFYWNQHFSDMPNIKLIICGSSASWIIKKIINNKGGLHNRVTERFHLKPFTLAEVKSLLSYQGVKLNNKHITELYMTTGGVPFYLQKIEPGASAAQIIDKLAFRADSILFTEFDNLLASLFNKADAYIDLLRIVSKHRSGLTQRAIAAKSKFFSSGGTCSKKLKELEDAGFLIKLTANTKESFYRLIDEYCFFYFHWIEPLRKTLQQQTIQTGYWEHIRNTPAWYAWAGYAFESICYQHLLQIRTALKLPPTAIPNSWRYTPNKGSEEKGAQIDLLFDRLDDAITLCEIKYTSNGYRLDKNEALNIQNKIKAYKSINKVNKQFFIALICSYPIKHSIYSEELIDQVITLDTLFNTNT